MLKTPWRPSVDVNPLFRPLSPKPSDLIIYRAWAKAEGCCRVQKIKGSCQRATRKMWTCSSTFYKLNAYFVPLYLFEGISVGLQTDFHHFEWIDNNSLSQAWAEACCRQCLEGRWTWFKPKDKRIIFGYGCSRTKELLQVTFETSTVKCCFKNSFCFLFCFLCVCHFSF